MNPQLQQERRKLMAELEEVRRERDGHQSQTEQLRRELSTLRTQLEETEWNLCQKSGLYIVCCCNETFQLIVIYFLIHFGCSSGW